MPSKRPDRRTAQERRQAETLGATIRTLRLKAGLSQEDLAHAAGRDRGYVGMLERGEGNPTFGVVLRLAHALEVTPGRLMRGVKGVPPRR